MKSVVLALATLVLVVVHIACGGSKLPSRQDTWISPAYAKKKYENILVVARLQEKKARAYVEKETVSYMKERRIKGTAAIDHVADFSAMPDSATLHKQLRDLGVDGAIVINFLGKMKGVVTTSAYDGGFYSVFTPDMIPYDIETYGVSLAYVKVDFLNWDSPRSQFGTTVEIKLSNGRELAINELLVNTFRRLFDYKVL
jgi:hypothetical protein